VAHSDVISARRLLFGLMAAEGLAVGAFAFAGTFAGILVFACLDAATGSAANATRMAIIARAFEGPARIHARSIMRTVTNVSIAVGAALGGMALLANSEQAFRAVLLGAGAIYVLGIFPVWKLPARVDASPRTPGQGMGSQGKASPWKDARYLLLTALAAVFGMQFGLAEVGVPLWIANSTQAPTAIVSVLLILNTAIVIVFQIPLSRGTEDLRKAGRVVALAGVLISLACIAYAFAAGVTVAAAVGLLLLAAVAHAFAEVLSQAGTWGLSFELANDSNAGSYQGMFAMGAGLGAMCAPFVVAGTALKYGLPGWAALAVVFMAAALGITAIARRARGVQRC